MAVRNPCGPLRCSSWFSVPLRAPCKPPVHAQQWSAACHATRREMAGAAIAAAIELHLQAVVQPAAAAAAGGSGVPGSKALAPVALPLSPQQPLKAECGSLDPRVAAKFMKAVCDAVLDMKLVSETDFQKERYKLQQREYRYYYEANKDKLPAVPDLSDLSGGLSNRTYFNFVNYVLWKVAAGAATSPEQRSALTSRCGALLVEELAPDLQQQLRQQASSAPTGRASCSQLVAAFDQLLSRLEAAYYLCSGYQIVWGQLPGGWPADWSSQEHLVGEVPSSQPAGGEVFQVKLGMPADIEGSVALRAEEDGFWGRSISSMMVHLLAAGGYPQQALSVDEYFYQDYWSGPQGLKDQVLLLLGDPLQQVEVPWKPTTLVQDWQLTAL